MSSVKETFTLPMLKRCVEVGARLATPDDLQNMSLAVEHLSPRAPGVDPVHLLVLMAVGLMANKVVSTLNGIIAKLPLPPDHPTDDPPPVPSWATDLLKGIGLEPDAPPPTGPVADIEEMRRRARAAGIVLV